MLNLLKKNCVVALLLLPLFIQAQQPVLTLPVGHQHTVTSVDFSKDGRLIATGSLDNSFILWDMKTGIIVRRTVTEGPVQQVLFTPDGFSLLTLIGQSNAGFYSRSKPFIQKWDIKTGNKLEKLPFSGAPGMSFLPRSGNLVVPEYTSNLDSKKESNAEMFDMTNPEKFQENLQKRREEVYKSDTAAENERLRQMRDAFYNMQYGTDKKKAQEEYKNKMKEMVEGSTAKVMGKNITLVDFKTLKPIATLNKEPGVLRILAYKNSEYIINDNKAWDLTEFINQHKERRTIKHAIDFNNSGKLTTSPGGGFIAAEKGNTVQLFHIEKNEPVAQFKTKGDDVRAIAFSPAGDTLYAYSNTRTIYFMEAWSTASYTPLLSYTMPWHYHATHIWLSADGRSFLTERGHGLLKLTISGDSLASFHGHSNHPSYHGFTKDNNAVYVAYDVNPMVQSSVKYTSDPAYLGAVRKQMEKAVDDEAASKNKTLSKEEREKQVDEKMKRMSDAIKSDALKGSVVIWDLLRGGLKLGNIDEYAGPPQPVSGDKNYELINQTYQSANKDAGKTSNNLLDMLKNSEDFNNEQLREDLKKMEKTGAATYIPEDLMKNPKALMSNYVDMMKGIVSKESLNGPVTLLINKKNGDSISLIRFDYTDWIMLNKKGYYMTSKNGARSLSYTRGLEVLSFEQFDTRYNRPDIVLKAIGKADPALIEAYRNAYEKRIKRLGIDTTQFRNDYNVPEADFANRDKIEVNRQSEKITLHIVAKDSKLNLLSYNVWVNEVPVFGKKGKSLTGAASRNLDTKVEIILSEGINRVETSVLNAAGAESYKVPLVTRYSPSAPRKNKLYFVGIGIDRFADTAYNLRYCEKDIRDLAAKFKEKYGADMETNLLFNEQVTVQNVRDLKQKLLQSQEDDKVIIVYSGHGLLSKNYDYYLSTHTVNFQQPEQNGLLYEELENLADGIRSRKKLMLIDACHSGEVDKEEMTKIAAVQATLKNNAVTAGTKGIKVPAKMGTKNSFELMQELFVNVSKGTGATIISAAGGTQFALEKGELKNGVFTYSVLEMLNSRKNVTVNELKKQVSNRVSELTQGLQQPVARNEMQATDWIVW